jgi:hypothetical protein
MVQDKNRLGCFEDAKEETIKYFYLFISWFRSIRNSTDNTKNIEHTMKQLQPIDYLRVTAFILTLVLIVYGMTKGLDDIELIINYIYFTIIIVVLMYDNMKIFLDWGE